MVSLANRALIWSKNAYSRVTLTKTTLAFFLFTFAHCFVQAFVLSFLFQLDSDACSLTSTITSAAQVPRDVFAWLSESHNDTTDRNRWMLKLCDSIPFEKEDEPCVLVFDSDDPSLNSVPSGFKRRDLSFLERRDGNESSLDSNTTALPGSSTVPSQALVQPFFDSADNVTGIKLTLPDVNDGQPIFLDSQCTRVVLYADQVLRNSKREVFAVIGLEFWMFSTSAFALMYGSIAHLFASLAFRVLSCAWAAYSIWRTHDIDRRFDVLLTQGACGIELFPKYVKPRITIQSVDFGINFIALILLAFLMTRLVKTYSTVMYKCIGPPDHVVKIYRYVLGLFTCLQIAVYLLITSASLWLDQLINGAIASISSHFDLYLSVFVTVLVLLIPWIVIGWRSVRLEQRRLLPVFIGLGLLFEAAWSGMYDSLVWRWTWIEWPFFASVAVASQIVLLASVALGIVCRLNFGKGLKEYLEAANALEKEDFEPEVFENGGKGKVSPGSSDDDGWEADLEKRFAAERLSQTLDFGAHQPAPPLSPSYDIPITPQQAAAMAPSRNHNPPFAHNAAARPTSFSSVIPSLPTLGKNAPWKKPEKDVNDVDISRFRF